MRSCRARWYPLRCCHVSNYVCLEFVRAAEKDDLEAKLEITSEVIFEVQRRGWFRGQIRGQHALLLDGKLNNKPEIHQR